MSGIHDQDRIDELRRRLYERGKPTKPAPVHELKNEPESVPTTWAEPPKPIAATPSPTEALLDQMVEPVPDIVVEDKPADAANDKLYPVKKTKKYRIKMVIIGLLFFVISVAFSSILLLRGNNVISGENISMAITGPFAIGGGEAIPLQVGITNDNTVAIQSATLIVDYPDGTKSVNDSTKDLFSERLSLETINPGETLNIPLRALVFGEENDEKEIKVSIEYRVSGSNALFFKEAEPLKFQISRTPIRLTTDYKSKVSSGQENVITLKITSNSPTTLENVLVKADYPTAFDYVESTPEPSLAQNMWLIDSLAPEETKEISITGILFGKETEEYTIDLSVGVAAEKSPQTLTSIFATDQIGFVVEQPFIDIDLRIAGSNSDEVAIEPGQQAAVVLEIVNTLEETIYDAVIDVTLSGNALSEVDVIPQFGFYNSANNTVHWDVGDVESLESIPPGGKARVTFTIEPDSKVNRTPQIDIKVNVSARRVTESRVTEQLKGTKTAVVRVISSPKVMADVGYNNNVFSDTGPVPPEVEKTTSYTLSMMVENGSNEITDTEVTASLPPYISWLDKTAGSGQVTFNPTNRVVTWKVGSVEANSSALASFQVSFLPSKSQIGTTPTILGEQRLRATDRFTGTTVRESHSALTTQLSSESGFGGDSGVVEE